MNDVIEIRNLRISNLLLYDNKIVHVTSLSMDIDDEYEDQINFCNYGETSNEKGGWNRSLVDKLSPIPLTPEWLERCGFEKQLPHYRKDEFLVMPNYSRDASGNYDGFYMRIYIERKLMPMVIRTVHQLQNLYFALTGEELQIMML